MMPPGPRKSTLVERRRLHLVSFLFVFLTLPTSDLAAQARPQASHGASPAASPGAVVARVNGTLITNAELEQELTAAGIAGHARTPKLAAEVRRQALEELIARELIYQEASKKGLRVTSAEVERALAEARKQAGAVADDKALRHSVERRLLVEKATALEIAKRVAVSDVEVERVYREQQGRFRKPEQLLLRAILAAFPPQPKPEERTAARQTIEKVQTELRKGGDFAALAGKYSEDAYRAKGGRIGWVHRGRLDPEVEKVAFNLGVGKVSPPFETKYGFLILKVEGKRLARQLTYAEVRENLRAELKQRKAAQARQAWIGELKQKARIEILLPQSS